MNHLSRSIQQIRERFRRLHSHALAVPLLLMATSAHADELSSLSGLICMIAGFIKGPFLFAGGLIIIVLAAVGIANSESTVVKFISGAGVGIGIAAASIPLLQKMGIGNVCSFT